MYKVEIDCSLCFRYQTNIRIRMSVHSRQVLLGAMLVGFRFLFRGRRTS